jgi:hypothetical protein
MPVRSDVVSSFTIIKGSLIDETYSAFAVWDETQGKKVNLDRMKAENTIRARSETWLRDVAKVLNRRFDPRGRDRVLITLAKAHARLDIFKPILLWHITRDEFLFRDFLVNFLYPRYESGTHRVDANQLSAFIDSTGERGGRTEHDWSDPTKKRVVAGLLRMAVDFDLLRGAVNREFVSYHLPEEAFLYLLHAIHDVEANAQRTIHSDEWKMYYMSPADVEQELFRLHQFRKLDFQIAGSLVQLTLPCGSAKQYAERMVA